MADEVDGNPSDNDNGPLTTGQRSQENEFGERGPQADSSPQGTDRDKLADLGTESPISGQGSQEPNRGGTAGRAKEDAGLESQARQSDGMSGQPIGGNDSATGTGTTLTQGADFGERTTSNAGGSSVGTDQTSGGSSGVGGGKDFIGSQASGSDDYLPEDASSSEPSGQPSSAEATGGNDFAREGRGALDGEDDGSSS